MQDSPNTCPQVQQIVSPPRQSRISLPLADLRIIARSPCPALNAIANHGFLPRSGKHINLAQVILGLFLGLGVSPEVSGFIGAIGMVSSSKPLTLSFDLEDLRSHMFAIEHDASFSRQDALIGNNNAFDQDLWEVALAQLNNSATVNPIDIGRAKSARIQDALHRNPRSVYGPRAAAFGFIEHGLILSASGSSVPGITRLDYLQCFFEQERLPYHLGWRPIPEGSNLATVLLIGLASIAGDGNLLTDADRILLQSPSVSTSLSRNLSVYSSSELQDILQTIVPPQYDFLANLTSIITELGFGSGVLNSLKSISDFV